MVNKSMSIKIIDLFCGAGGFAEGFLSTRHNFKLVYALDIDKWASETARKNHPNTRVDNSDIRKIDPKKISREIKENSVDLIIGGPPCQGFSSLRPNRASNLNDSRNSLFSNFANFIEVFRPKIFVMENVVGLATHDNGRTLQIIEETFTSLNYLVDWKILNAASYGVPQKRERLIMIGTRDNEKVGFPKPQFNFSGKVIGHKDKNRILLAPNLDKVKSALTVNDAISDLPRLSRGQYQDEYKLPPQNKYQKQRRGKSNSLTLHKAANHSDKMLEIIKHAGDSISSIPAGLITSGFSSCYSRLNGDAPSTTITVKFQSPASSKCIHPKQHRTITPREAARIQSFNDDYVFMGPLTHVASQIGNAVPPLLGKAIGNHLGRYL